MNSFSFEHARVLRLAETPTRRREASCRGCGGASRSAELDFAPESRDLVERSAQRHAEARRRAVAGRVLAVQTAVVVLMGEGRSRRAA
jgi:hypothetical protein